MREPAECCDQHARIDDPAGTLRRRLLKPSLVITEEENQG
jgi:hypothetical protein